MPFPKAPFLTLLLLTLSSFVPVSTAQADGACQFVLGFQTLHDAIPQVVGDCTENQHFSAIGDAVQRTTNGLLVWRKLSNSTAFTNGGQTWVNGPYGVQGSRGNDQRYAWEVNAGGGAQLASQRDATHELLFETWLTFWEGLPLATNQGDYSVLASVTSDAYLAQLRQRLEAARASGQQPHVDFKVDKSAYVCVTANMATLFSRVAEQDTPVGSTTPGAPLVQFVAVEYQLGSAWQVVNERKADQGEVTLDSISPKCS